MSHTAQTDDLIEVVSWTGDVPREGEIVRLNPARPGAAAGMWKVELVEWAISSGVEALSRAELTIRPIDDDANAWHAAARAERNRAEAAEA